MNYTELPMSDLSVKLMNCKRVRDRGGIITSIPSGGGCRYEELITVDVDAEGLFNLPPVECEKCTNISILLYKKTTNSETTQNITHLRTNRFDRPGIFNLLKLNSPTNRARTDTGIKLSDWLEAENTVRGVNIKYKFYQKNNETKPILEHEDMYENGLGSRTANKPESYQSANRYFSLDSDGSQVDDIVIKAQVYLKESLYGETKLSSASFIQSSYKLSVPTVIIETKKYRTTLDGGYTGEVLPIYKDGTLDRLTNFVKIENSNFACENGILNGALIIDGRVIKARNGICEPDNVEFDVENIPLELVETGEIMNFSGRAKTTKVTHRYVGLEVCDPIQNKCAKVSLFRRK